jgi:prepilin-type N-terminal cleavage/methylation domain-containing protein
MPVACNHRTAVDPRKGMTLVELLVVIGILLLLLVTVTPILSPTPDQKGREAAATVLSMIDRAKTRATDIENSTYVDRGAGVWIEPLVTSGSVRYVAPNAFVQLDGANLSMASLDLFACEPQDKYNGDDSDAARAFAYNPNSLNAPISIFVPGFRSDERLVLFEENSCPFIRNFCSASSEITIPSGGGQTYYFRLLTAAEQSGLSENYFPKPYRSCNLAPGGGQLSADHPQWQNPNPPEGETSNYYQNVSAPPVIVGWIRLPAGATAPSPENGPWSPPFDPTLLSFPVSAQGTSFQITRPNTRTATPPLSVPAGYAVDVAWSSYGTLLLHNAVDVNRAGNGSKMQLIDNFLSNQPVQVMFSGDGVLTHLVVRRFITGFGVGSGAAIDDKLALNADLFLLVGRADRIGRPYLANPTDANPGANWQYPDSRWIKISYSTGKTLIADPYPDVDNVYDSQRYARSDIAAVRN